MRSSLIDALKANGNPRARDRERERVCVWRERECVCVYQRGRDHAPKANGAIPRTPHPTPSGLQR